MKGWVYVFSNKAMPGLVKVGFSTKAPELRAAELNHTGSPYSYVVEYEMLIEEPYQIEQQTHRLLSAKRAAKEWFRCSAEEAVAAIKQIAGPRAISETYKRAERAKAEALHQQELEKQEASRKREKAKKDFENWLRNEEATIHEKYERLIAETFSPRPFGPFWLMVGILLLSTLALLDTEIPVGQELTWGLFLLVFFGGIVAFFLNLYFEKKDIQSCLLKQRDEELAVVRARGQWYRLAEEQGDVNAQCNLGNMYSNGQGVPQDYAEAVKWYRLAADQGFEEAAKRLEELEKSGFPLKLREPNR